MASMIWQLVISVSTVRQHQHRLQKQGQVAQALHSQGCALQLHASSWACCFLHGLLVVAPLTAWALLCSFICKPMKPAHSSLFPWLLRCICAGTVDFLRNLEMSEDELAKAIIGTIGDVDAYQLPGRWGVRQLFYYYFF